MSITIEKPQNVKFKESTHSVVKLESEATAFIGITRIDVKKTVEYQNPIYERHSIHIDDLNIAQHTLNITPMSWTNENEKYFLVHLLDNSSRHVVVRSE